MNTPLDYFDEPQPPPFDKCVCYYWIAVAVVVVITAVVVNVANITFFLRWIVHV